MKRKRIVTALLSISMLFGLLAGCGGGGTSSAASSTSAAPEQEPSAASNAAAPEQPEVEEASAPEEGSAMEAAEPEHPTLSYPVGDGEETFRMLQVYNPNASAVYGNEGDYSTALTYQTLAEKTGVNIEFKMLAEASFSTQIDLIIASGDTPDFYGRSLGSYDSKLQAAVEEEVVIDILPLVEENAPDLYALMEKDPDWKTKLTNSDGTICKIASYTLPKTTDGPFIRKDWLDNLGLEAPTDLDSLTNVLEAFKSEYNCSMPLLLDSDLGSVLDQCFNMQSMGFNSFSFQQDAPNSGKVICSLCTDEYINYLLTLNEYLNKGLITSDFLNISKNAGNLEACYIDGNAGVWKDDAKYTYNNAISAQESDPNWEAIPFVFDKNDYHMNQSSTSGGIGLTQLYISANCENPELALQFVNYAYTDEGALLVQAGEEGVTYTKDADGKLAYTDVIINNPDGWTSSQATYLYLTDAWMPTRQLEEVFEMAYTDDVLAAYDTWTNAYAGDDSMTIPLDCTLSADEQTEVFTLMADCLSLFSQNAAKVILGDLDEAGYRAVIDDAMGMGLERITEIYQTAYDRYMEA